MVGGGSSREQLGAAEYPSLPPWSTFPSGCCRRTMRCCHTRCDPCTRRAATRDRFQSTDNARRPIHADPKTRCMIHAIRLCRCPLTRMGRWPMALIRQIPSNPSGLITASPGVKKPAQPGGTRMSWPAGSKTGKMWAAAMSTGTVSSFAGGCQSTDRPPILPAQSTPSLNESSASPHPCRSPRRPLEGSGAPSDETSPPPKAQRNRQSFDPDRSPEEAAVQSRRKALSTGVSTAANRRFAALPLDYRTNEIAS